MLDLLQKYFGDHLYKSLIISKKHSGLFLNNKKRNIREEVKHSQANPTKVGHSGSSTSHLIGLSIFIIIVTSIIFIATNNDNIFMMTNCT